MHVVWVNDRADFVGGAERYVAETAARLGERGVRSTLLYDVHGWTEPRFVGRFDAAFPRVDLGRQLADLAPDLVYVHQVRAPAPLAELSRGDAPVARFLHDHSLFCLREHKYTTIGHRTCTRRTGPVCYPCLGFVGRSERWPGVRLRSLPVLQEDQSRHGRLLDAVVVGSRYMRDHVVMHGLPSERVHVLPLFVEPPPPMLPVERDPNELLFVGGLLRGKGVDLLLSAMASLPAAVHLRVVGDGLQRAELERDAGRLGLGARVRFDGKLAAEDLHAAYARAACLVMPSRGPETFGLTGPEALAHRTPVVASRAGGVGEWLEEGVTGLGFEPGDVRGLAAALRRVLTDPEAARRMGAEGERRVRERQSPERHDEALLSLFARLGARQARWPASAERLAGRP